MTCAEEKTAAALAGKVKDLFPLSILTLYYMEKEGTSLGKTNL
jgi:hypothetical protein